MNLCIRCKKILEDDTDNKPVNHVFNILEKCLNVKDVIVIILALIVKGIINHTNVV